jgi:hypothetical protein
MEAASLIVTVSPFEAVEIQRSPPAEQRVIGKG